MNKIKKVLTMLLALAMLQAFMSNLVFADGEEGARPFEVFISAHYTDMEQGQDDLNSSQAIPGMELCLCADVEENGEEADPKDYSFQWSLGKVERLDLGGYTTSDFAGIKAGDENKPDASVSFRPWAQVLSDHHADNAALEGALREGFTLTFELTVTKGEKVVKESFEIDLNDEYVELCPVDENCLADMKPGETRNVATALRLIRVEEGKIVRKNLDNTQFTWLKGSPWGLVEELDGETKQTINQAYKNETWNEGKEDWDEDDEWYAINYLWTHDRGKLPVITEEDGDVSITATEGGFAVVRKAPRAFEITLLATSKDWDDGRPVFEPFRFWNQQEGREFPWRICFDGDSEYDWAHFYHVDSKDAAIPVNDLNITVLDEEGKTLDPTRYELSIVRSWWEDEQEKEEAVGVAAGIHDQSGFTEYVARATITSLGKKETVAEGTFFVIDKHALEYIGSRLRFDRVLRMSGWRMHDRFCVSSSDASSVGVVTRSGVTLDKKDYTLTWFKRGAGADINDPKDPNFPGMEDVLNIDPANKLNQAPTEPGEYFVHYEAKAGNAGGYYGGNDVLVDVVSDEEAAKYPCPHDNYGQEIREVPATCTEPGTKAHYQCAACHKLFVKEGDSYVEKTEAELVIPPKGHKLVEVKLKKASATAVGNIRYWKCSDCGKCFSDAAGKTVVSGRFITIPKDNVSVKLKKKQFSAKKKKNTVLKTSSVFDVKNAKGKVSYKKTSGAGKITVAGNGKITVKKGLKAKVYSVKVKVTSAASSKYNAFSKELTVKIKVK